MQAINERLSQLPEMAELLSRLSRGGCPAVIGGLSSVHKAHIIAAVRQKTGRPVVVLCPDEMEAARIGADIAAFTDESLLTLPPREYSFYNVETVSREWEHVRIPVLYKMALGIAPVVTGAADAFLQRSASPDSIKDSSVVLRPNMEYPLDKLLDALTQGGYKRADQVEGIGQFAVRGGIVDFFSPGEQNPVRLEYFGDEIDTLASIDVLTQRRIHPLTQTVLLSCMETLPHTATGGIGALAEEIEKYSQEDAERLRETGNLPAIDRYMGLISPKLYAGVDFIPRKAIVFIIEQNRTRERVQNTLWRQNQDIESLLEAGIYAGQALGYDELGFNERLSEYDVVYLDAFLASAYDLRPHSLMSITAKQLPSYGASLDTAAGDIEHYRSGGFTSVVLCGDDRRGIHLQELLQERGIPASLASRSAGLPPEGGVYILTGSLSAGVEYPDLKLVVLTEGETTPRRMRKASHSAAKKDNKRRIASYADLTTGDLVVHDHHGIGRFTGVVKMQVDGIERDYIKIAYAGSDILYVPVTQLHLVGKYIGRDPGEEGTGGAKLNKLGGQDWQKAKTRAKAAVKELAQGLTQLYAERKRRPGFSFPKDDDWQTSFENAFPYEETDDQLRCVAEIKADMQSSYPMDRLLCGDVGFGKTEVALRAVMKCVMGGKQAAILVPTTVLAQQHYETAVRRFSRYPVRVEMMSRFRTPAQLAETLKHIRMGSVDLVIGTHKLLQKNIKFKDLGLLVVDEEQRFGVTHKERLKELARQVDVLTLTATPIPRTLNMALSGIRDMSTIEEAPRDRFPVQTFVMGHNWSIIADAVRREVSRGGQVYYLHNRVETISSAAVKLANLVPDINIGVAHGKMKEEELSEVMRQTFDGELQVLVCTTIIETGIDIPNVNTLIVEDADRLGLAQLHQIRGRVGRSPRHAFAYLTYRTGKILTEVASKRLTAIREFAEFGSGFKIAMRDLEIRGAGNVLGAQQSGHLVTVGYDMYLRLLEEAVLEERGELAGDTVDCTADLTVSAGIPDGYVKNAGLRMDLYRRIAALQDNEDADDLIDELIDRFGDVPRQTDMLIRIALLRARAGRAGITELSQKKDRLHVKFKFPDFAKISILCSMPEFKGRLLFSAGDTPYLSCKLLSKESVMETADAIVAAYAKT